MQRPVEHLGGPQPELRAPGAVVAPGGENRTVPLGRIWSARRTSHVIEEEQAISCRPFATSIRAGDIDAGSGPEITPPTRVPLGDYRKRIRRAARRQCAVGGRLRILKLGSGAGHQDRARTPDRRQAQNAQPTARIDDPCIGLETRHGHGRRAIMISLGQGLHDADSVPAMAEGQGRHVSATPHLRLSPQHQGHVNRQRRFAIVGYGHDQYIIFGRNPTFGTHSPAVHRAPRRVQ